MRFTILFACAAIASCSTGSTDGAAPRLSVESQERLWEEARPTNYRYHFQQQCFCLPAQVQPVIVEVRDDRIVRVTSVTSGQDVPDDPNLRWPTIPELFELVAGAETDRPDELVVRYDPRFGYPTHIEIGSLAADAGVVYTATGLEPL